MIICAYSFSSSTKLWLKYYRRGSSYELESNRATSPRSYGMMLRSVASRGGGPGSRWTYFHASSGHWKSGASPAPNHLDSSDRNEWNHLRYGGVDTPGDIYVMDDADDTMDWHGPQGHKCAAQPSVQCGYQDRCELPIGVFTLGKVGKPILVGISEHGSLAIRFPPCGHTVIRILNPWFVQSRQYL